MKPVLSERDQFRALMLLATACGANRVAAVVEGRVRYAELGSLYGGTVGYVLAIVGAFLAAALVHRGGARMAAILAAATCALGAVSSAIHVVSIGSALSTAGTGAFTVGSLAFAAELLVPDDERVSPSRFAGMAAFVLARVAIMDLGALLWFEMPYEVSREPFVAHGLAIALGIASVMAVVFALPRARGRDAATPEQPVYRAPSPMDEPAAAPPPAAPSPWPALRALLAPAALFAVCTSAISYRMGSTASNLFGGLAALAGAIHFVRVWRRRSAVFVIDWYAHGLMVASVGWLLSALGTFLGVVTFFGVIVASIGSAASALSLGLIALAGRGRRSGVALACWLLLSNVATLVGQVLAGAGLMLLIGAIASFFVARNLKRRATALEAWF